MIFLILEAVCIGLGALIAYVAEFDMLIGVGIGAALIPAGFLLKFLGKSVSVGSGAGAGVKGKTADGKELEQYYDAKWVTDAELAHTERFMPCTYKTLDRMKDGILINCQMKGSNLNINMYAPIHTMIIGTTGSGKSQCYISPSLRILSKTSTKPCIVCTDPKGEMFNEHSLQLKDAGYRIMVLDLRQPYASTRWNPMDNAYVQYHRSFNLEKEIKVHRTPVSETKLKKAAPPNAYGPEWLEFMKTAYPNRAAIETDLQSKAQQLRDEAENELREVASTVVDIQSKNDSTWEQGAQDFFYGLMLAMLEDSLDKDLGMTRERFNFYNLAKIATYKDPDPDNPFGTLRDYCAGRNKYSKVQALTSTCINNAPNTTRSYMGVLQGKISIFQDMGVCYATSFNEMYFDDFVDQPTAFFIKVPDEKESRHCIATMCISQLYKKLIEKASENKDLRLSRNVHFMLDEFANLPKINKMESLITVGRSRGIFFSLVIQSYAQLDGKYGKEAAEVIKGNCNIQIFIGTEDQKTREEFEKMCGQVSIETEQRSSNRDERGEGGGTSYNTSKQRVTRPLIYAYELGQLPQFTIIVKIFKESPMKVPMTPFFKMDIFDKRKVAEQYVPSKPLDEARIYYDIKIRNRKYVGGGDDAGGFGGFDF